MTAVLLSNTGSQVAASSISAFSSFSLPYDTPLWLPIVSKLKGMGAPGIKTVAFLSLMMPDLLELIPSPYPPLSEQTWDPPSLLYPPYLLSDQDEQEAHRLLADLNKGEKVVSYQGSLDGLAYALTLAGKEPDLSALNELSSDRVLYGMKLLKAQPRTGAIVVMADETEVPGKIVIVLKPPRTETIQLQVCQDSLTSLMKIVPQNFFEMAPNFFSYYRKLWESIPEGALILEEGRGLYSLAPIDVVGKQIVFPERPHLTATWEFVDTIVECRLYTMFFNSLLDYLMSISKGRDLAPILDALPRQTTRKRIVELTKLINRASQRRDADRV